MNFTNQDIIGLLNVLVVAITAAILYFSFRETRKTAYIHFLTVIAPIIQRHHSQEITDLRRIVMTQLDSEALKAKEASKTLFQLDPKLHSEASTLANYYESLGMVLQGSWHILPDEMKSMFLAMLHNSVSKTWSLYEKHKDVIYPNRPRDWAQSYQWLFHIVDEYRKKNNL